MENREAISPTTIDRLLGGRVLLEQPVAGFRAAIDAVLLAAALDPRAGATVLDAGCGSGAATLCLARRRPDLALTGLELDPGMAALAVANLARNGLEAMARIETGDLLAPPPGPAPGPFATLMTNPPFHPQEGRAADGAGRALAMVDRAGAAAWLNACLRRLAPRGRLVLIHRADRLPELLAALAPAMGDIEIIPLWPMADGRPARRVIIRCRKDARGPATLAPGLVLHRASGKFTEAAEAVLRDGLALDAVL